MFLIVKSCSHTSTTSICPYLQVIFSFKTLFIVISVANKIWISYLQVNIASFAFLHLYWCLEMLMFVLVMCLIQRLFWGGVPLFTFTKRKCFFPPITAVKIWLIVENHSKARTIQFLTFDFFSLLLPNVAQSSPRIGCFLKVLCYLFNSSVRISK